MAIRLTGLEIKHLAESAGFTVDDDGDTDLLEGEHYIRKGPKHGVTDDDGKVKHYDWVTTCDGCEGNECTPLGNPIDT